MSDFFGSDFDEFAYDEDAAQFDWWQGGDVHPAYQEEVTLQSLTEYGGDYYTATADDWLTLLTQSDEYLIENYDMDHYDIIDQLRDYGYWDDETDWDLYGEAHGS